MANSGRPTRLTDEQKLRKPAGGKQVAKRLPLRAPRTVHVRNQVKLACVAITDALSVTPHRSCHILQDPVSREGQPCAKHVQKSSCEKEARIRTVGSSLLMAAAILLVTDA